jgi:hypothetical protein
MHAGQQHGSKTSYPSTLLLCGGTRNTTHAGKWTTNKPEQL